MFKFTRPGPRANTCSFRLLICCIVVFPLSCSRSKSKEGAAGDQPLQDKPTMVVAGDPDMEAAFAKARSKLPLFWKAFERPTRGETKFALKVKITDASGAEYFWVNRIQKKGDKVSGTINNEPHIVKSVKLGQRIDIADDQIVDWLFMRNDKMVGNETLRPILKKMPKEEAAKHEAIMEEP